MMTNFMLVWSICVMQREIFRVMVYLTLNSFVMDISLSGVLHYVKPIGEELQHQVVEKREGEVSSRYRI